MESLYEEPRSVPIPSSTQKAAVAPTVPEISIVLQNSPNENADSIYLTYKAWKGRQRECENNLKQNPFDHGKDCISQGKQVRFDGPNLLMQQKSKNGPFTASAEIASQSRNRNETSAPTKLNMLEEIYLANVPNRHLDLSIIETPKTVCNKENIEYFDLDKFDNRRTQFNDAEATKPNHTSNKLNDCHFSKTYQPNKKLIENSNDWTPPNSNNPLEKNRVIDLYNYKRGGFDNSMAYAHRKILDNLKIVDPCNVENYQEKKTYRNEVLNDSFDSHVCVRKDKEVSLNVKRDASTQTNETNSSSVKNEPHIEESSFKDMLSIISKQNDQILMLQKQVALLLNNRDVPKCIEAPVADKNLNFFDDKCRTSTQLETHGISNPLSKCLPRKGPLQHFSLDVMTSFEVSIRRQQNVNKAYKEAMNQQPKICEVTETDSNFSEPCSRNVNRNGNILDGIAKKSKTSNDTEVSLTLNEPVHVRETCPTPENVVCIDMEDYSSDSDEENSDEEWLYQNIKGQVNQILKKSGIWPKGTSPVTEMPDNTVPQNIRRKVKDATIKHLKSIGVHVPNLDDTPDIVENQPNRNENPEEVSFMVKQLLMKYLPNEHLAKLAQHNVKPQVVPQHGLIKRRSDFSFATVQYMQKYNLLSDSSNGSTKANKPPQTNPVVRQGDNFDRILDITAIRQQPKLL